MALTKETSISKTEIVGDYKHVQVRTDTIIKEDDVEISRKHHRHVLAPDDDITNEHADVKAICNLVWTDSVKAAWKTYKESLVKTED
tara:strand:- start:49 stop:309 length:261 start_codon:yes stop_codon:yes gene_type:complete